MEFSRIDFKQRDNDYFFGIPPINLLINKEKTSTKSFNVPFPLSYGFSEKDRVGMVK